MQFRPLPLNMPRKPSLRNIWTVPCGGRRTRARAGAKRAGRGAQQAPRLRPQAPGAVAPHARQRRQQRQQQQQRVAPPLSGAAAAYAHLHHPGVLLLVALDLHQDLEPLQGGHAGAAPARVGSSAQGRAHQQAGRAGTSGRRREGRAFPRPVPLLSHPRLRRAPGSSQRGAPLRSSPQPRSPPPGTHTAPATPPAHRLLLICAQVSFRLSCVAAASAWDAMAAAALACCCCCCCEQVGHSGARDARPGPAGGAGRRRQAAAAAGLRGPLPPCPDQRAIALPHLLELPAEFRGLCGRGLHRARACCGAFGAQTGSRAVTLRPRC